MSWNNRGTRANVSRLDTDEHTVVGITVPPRGAGIRDLVDLVGIEPTTASTYNDVQIAMLSGCTLSSVQGLPGQSDSRCLVNDWKLTALKW